MANRWESKTANRGPLGQKLAQVQPAAPKVYMHEWNHSGDIEGEIYGAQEALKHCGPSVYVGFLEDGMEGGLIYANVPSAPEGTLAFIEGEQVPLPHDFNGAGPMSDVRQILMYVAQQTEFVTPEQIDEALGGGDVGSEPT